MKIREMNVSARTKSCLLSAGYTESDDLLELSDDELLAIKNINQKCVDEIHMVLSSHYANYDFDNSIRENVELRGSDNSNEALNTYVHCFAMVSLVEAQVDDGHLYLIFEMEARGLKEHDEIVYEINALQVNYKDIDISSWRMWLSTNGVLNDSRIVTKKDLDGLNICEGEKIVIWYKFVLRRNDEVLDSGIENNIFVTKARNKPKEICSGDYETQEQVIFNDQNLYISFIAPFENNDEIVWLIKTSNKSDKEQFFNLKYARIYGTNQIYEIGRPSNLSVFPGETKLNLVHCDNPMGVSLRGSRIQIEACDNEWPHANKYLCMPFELREVYDEEFMPTFQRLEVNDQSWLTPNLEIANQKWGRLVYEMCEDKTGYLIPRYGLTFRLYPTMTGEIKLKVYINGLMIEEKFLNIKIKEQTVIEIGLSTKALRWNGIKEDDIYLMQLQILFKPVRKELCEINNEYRVKIRSLKQNTKIIP